MTPAKAFGSALRQVRLSRGLSQEKLGLITNLDRTYISGIERGRRNPTLQIIWILARAVGERPSGLLRIAEDFAGEA